MKADRAYEIAGIRKTYDSGRVVANAGIDLEVGRGEIFGLLGPNGAGKSTLVRQMVGLLRPDAGTITLFGRAIGKDADWVSGYVSFLPQRPLALLDLTVAEAVRYTGRLRGLPAGEAERQCRLLLDELDLARAAHRLVGRLSGGQHRLVGVAVALIADLPLLVLDEPTNELDPYNRRVVWQKLLAVNKERGTTIVLVTHNVLEAERVVQRVALIKEGTVVAVGSPGDLKARVDRRVRLELSLREEFNGMAHELGQLGEVIETTGNRLLLLVERARVGAAVDLVLSKVTLEQLDDFRVLMPSLEDVYLTLGGGGDVDRLEQDDGEGRQ